MTRPIYLLLAVAIVLSPTASAASHRKHSAHHAKSKSRAKHAHHRASADEVTPAPAPTARYRRVSYTASDVPLRHSRTRGHLVFNPWSVPTFADSTDGDRVDGEDLAVRLAAVQALGPYNGSVVVADPETGRVLTIVNQKLALKDGFEPCSTIKVVASLAGLSEGVIDPDSEIRTGRRSVIGLTDALAHSNNFYFATVGNRLGFNKITEYAKLFGLGEKAGLNIDGENVTPLPGAAPDDGLGMMTSFGEGFYLTPLQLTAIIGAVANGGSLYYLQYPRSKADIDGFVPRVKRHLDIEKHIPSVRPGMMGAVEFGTARRARFDADQPIFGKTGTCTDNRSPTHLGWFGSFQEVAGRRLVVVVLLTGGHAVSGPVASGIAGTVYRNLIDQGYYSQLRRTSPAALVSTRDSYIP